jgi:hypothetical protein
MPEKFLSVDLHKIKNRLPGAPRKIDTDVSADETDSTTSVQALQQADHEKAEPKILREDPGHGDRIRDLAVRIGESIAILENERNAGENRLASLRNALDRLKELDSRIRNIRLDNASDRASSGQDGLTHTVESTRIELARIWSAVHPERHLETDTLKMNRTRKSGNPISEIASIGFFQLFRIGFGLFLPAILAVLAASALIAASMMMIFTK